MGSALERVREFDVLADHMQFFLQDLVPHGEWVREEFRTGSNRPAAGWTHEAVLLHRIGVEKYSIAVGTARNDRVAVALHLRSAAPDELIADAVHIVEADLAVATGELAVSGPADKPGTEWRITLEPHRYRVRVSFVPDHSPISAYDEDEPGDHFLYALDLWPVTEPAELQVLRQGPSPWAG